MIGATALLTLMAGCATTTTTSTHDEERSMLVASGFKMVTPKTAAQQHKLQQLETGQVAMIQKEGKTYYVVADPSRNVVYVGEVYPGKLGRPLGWWMGGVTFSRILDRVQVEFPAVRSSRFSVGFLCLSSLANAAGRQVC